jgi:hypothetical protein
MPGIPGPLFGVENFCLTRRTHVGLDGEAASPVHSDWVLSSVKVSRSLREFCGDSDSPPSGSVWSIPHLTIPIVEYGMSSGSLRRN